MEKTQNEQILALYIDRVRYQDSFDQVHLKMVECEDEIGSLMNEIRTSLDDAGIITDETSKLADRTAAAHRKWRFWHAEQLRLCCKLGGTLERLSATG